MTSKQQGERVARTEQPDLGLEAVDYVYEHMSIEDRWAVREERGFTWWGDWVRQRVWSAAAVRSHGSTLWHVRARTPVYRDMADTPETYAFLQELNAVASLSAYVYDPDDGTISSRCGVFVYGEVAPWLEKYLLAATGLQSSFAWLQAPAQADGRALDDAAHPTAGRPEEPDDMLNAARTWATIPSPITLRTLREAAGMLASEGLTAVAGPGDGLLRVLLPDDEDTNAMWMLGTVDHPVLGPGIGVRLLLPGEVGMHQGAWLANALNLAESADWEGQDRPHALGAWHLEGRALAHDTFVPASLLGALDDDGGLLAIRNFLAWGAMRAKAATERLPWLLTAAASRYPDDELAELPDGASDEDEPPVPWEERSFGPGSRTPRARPETGATHEPTELIVDPADPDAYAEIDAAVEAADDGDTIVVRPGTYRVPVVVDRAVAIRGDGPREDIRLEPVGGEAIGFAASGASVTGLTIRPALAGNDGTAHSAVAVHNAQVEVSDCTLSTHLGATVWVGGASSFARLRGCTIRDGAQNAVWVTEEGRAEVEGCRISGHRWPLTVGGEHTSLVVRDCEIVDNFDQAIAALPGATLVVEGCTVARNAGGGVWLAAAGAGSRVERNRVSANGGTGIFVESCRARVADNDVDDNDLGIAVLGVMGPSAPTVEANRLSGNRIGIGVRGEHADPRVVDNTVVSSGRDGIVVDQGAIGRFDANSVSDSERAGAWTSDEGTRPRFTGNHLRGGATGVAVTGSGGGEFRSNDLRGNRDGSWHLEEPGPLVREDNLEDAGSRPDASPEPPKAANGGSPPPTLVN